MSATSLPAPLDHFLRSYMAVQNNLRGSVETFVRTETPDTIQILMDAIRRVFQRDESELPLRQELERAGNLRLGQTSARTFLVDLYSFLAREAKFPEDVKPYDAFISYSSADQQLAAWLASELRRQGYAIWLDRDEILVGHSILDEVYRGIRQSRFLIVLLTRASVNSRWVKEELSAARLEEIENARVTVLPAKCDRDVEIPQVLRGKRWADFTSSSEDGLQSMMRAMDLVRAGLQEPPTSSADTTSQPETHNDLRTWYLSVRDEPQGFGFDPTKGGYKDTVIGLVDGENVRYALRDLRTLLDRTRVRIKGWGGAPFPYKELPRAQVQNLADGIRLVDAKSWPFSEWSFTCWRLTDSLRFFQRSNLLEDGEVNERGQAIYRGQLSVLWTVQDICTALTFAANLLHDIASLKRLVVIHRLVGMDGRRLVFRNALRLPMTESFAAREPEIEQEAVIARGTDLEVEAIRMLSNIFWLFHWVGYSPEFVRHDVRSFLAGQFPVGS